MILPFKKTFKGADGKVYICNAKLKFPEHIRQQLPIKETAKFHPDSYLETGEIARRLRCSSSAVRQYLHRRGVEFSVVTSTKGGKYIFWNRDAVEKALDDREPDYKRMPAGYIGMREAVDMLGVVRSYIYKLADKGLVRFIKCRMRSTKGARVRCLYNMADLKCLSLRLRQTPYVFPLPYEKYGKGKKTNA